MWKITEFWLPGVIKKISLFLFLMTSVIFITFLIGNPQEFLDSTQLLLLRIFEISAAAFIITGVYNIIFTVSSIINRRSYAVLSLGIILSGEAIVISFYILSNLIYAVTESVI